jgi:hypothetical protein
LICHIYPVASAAGKFPFQWRWRSRDGKRKSSRAFELYYDCVQDARSHGVDVDLDRAHHEIAAATVNVKIVAQATPGRQR